MVEQNISSDWYFDAKGTVKGPINIHDLEILISTGELNNESVVWRQGFNDWKKIGETELADLIINDTPPPLTGSKINNSYAWGIATAPIWGVILEYIFLNNASEGIILLFWFLLNSILAIIDDRQLKKAGYAGVNLGWILLIPVYLWKRANLTHQPKIHFWFWIGSFLASILLFEATSKPDYLFEDQVELQSPVSGEEKNEQQYYNTSDESIFANGNFSVAANEILNSDPNWVWQNSAETSPAQLTKSVYKMIGKPVKLTGRVYLIEELPPTPGISGDWSEILITVDNPNSPLGSSTISFIYNGNVDEISTDDVVMCAGYFIGTYESENAFGGAIKVLVLVGNALQL